MKGSGVGQLWTVGLASMRRSCGRLKVKRGNEGCVREAAEGKEKPNEKFVRGEQRLVWRQ